MKDDGALRELLLALPGETEDVYVRHQQVWLALHPYANHGRDFLYRMVSPRLALVRSDSLPTGKPAALRSGSMLLDLVASDRYDRNKERAVPTPLIPDWSAKLLRANGFEPTNIEVVTHGVAVGVKPARGEAPAHRIRYGVARLRLELRIASPSDAARAWRTGVGRGRRFGFGMLAHA